jgi:acyl-coenzyme A thioesterase PaaI-like protein
MPVELLSRSSAVASPAPPDPGLRPAISRLGAVVTSLGVTEAGLRVPPRSSILDPGGRPDPGALAMVADVATSLALRAATAGSQCRILDFSVSYRWPAAAVPGPLDAKASVVHRGLGTVVVSGDITGPTGLAVLVTTTSLVAEG